MNNFELAKSQILTIRPKAFITELGYGSYVLEDGDENNNLQYLSGIFTDPNECWINAAENLLSYISTSTELTSNEEEWQKLTASWNHLSELSNNVLKNPTADNIDQFYNECQPGQITKLIENLKTLIEDNNVVWDGRQQAIDSNAILTEKINKLSIRLNNLLRAQDLSRMLNDNEDDICYMCSEKTDRLSENPSAWPLKLPFENGNGKFRIYHVGCIVGGLESGANAYLKKETLLNSKLLQVTEERDAAMIALESQRYSLADPLFKIRKSIKEHEWLRLGRGSYEYDDDKWRDEFGCAITKIEEAIEPIEKIMKDWSNCPTDSARLLEARNQWRDRALKAEAELSRLENLNQDETYQA